MMKLIVGLGNPGEEHENNRHNVGFMVLDRLAEGLEWEVKFDSLIAKAGETIYIKPQTFMNRSGMAVRPILYFYKVDPANLWLIHDDLDIRLGGYKIQKGVGPKVHNGVASVEEQTGTPDFWRVRIGVDNRPTGEGKTPGDEYVLADFSAQERPIIDDVIEKVIGELRRL